MSKIVTAPQAAQLIPDEAVVTVSSSSGLGCPDAVLKAIGARFDRDGAPRKLTMIHPIAAGDMYGIKGIEHLARKGLLHKVLAGSYPSGPSSMAMPEIWRMIVENEIAAYNVPSGILFDMLRDAAAKRPGVLTKVGLDTHVDPDREGCAMNAVARDTAADAPVVKKIRFENDEWLFFPAVVPRVAIIRATSADERGNLSYEHEGAYLGALDQALAARNNGGLVIAQVKRVVKAGSMRPFEVHVPGILVDRLVVAPDQMQTTNTPHDPAISGEVIRPEDSFALMDWGPEKAIARRVAMELTEASVVALGFGISANVPRILLEEDLHGAVTWVIEQGAVGGVPLLGFKFGCAANAEAMVPSPHQFTYFQGAGFDAALLSFLEIDRHGNVNVSKLGARPHLTAGCGGFVDITAHARRIVFGGFFTAGAKLSLDGGRLSISREGKIRKLVEEVEQVTFSGRAARAKGQRVTYVTERCVMELMADGLLVREIAPGVDLERDILAQARFPLAVSDKLAIMTEALFRPDPFGLRLRTRSSPEGGGP